MSVGFDPAYREALLAQLRRQVRREKRPIWRRPGTLTTAGLIAGVAIAGTATAAAAGVIGLPGARATTPLGQAIVQQHQGSATIDLGAVPKGATNIAVEFWCLSPGTFMLNDGSKVTCKASDVGSQSSATLPLGSNPSTTAVSTAPDASWRISVAYVNQTTTPWAVNAHGQSYGVENEHGTPDLVAVQSTSGKDGYVLSKALRDADGTTAAQQFTSPQDALRWQEEMAGKTVTLPVYLSDGTTQVGEFVIAYPAPPGK